MVELVESLWQDARYALRSLVAARLFASAAIVTMAVGIGASVGIFSAVNATLLRPLTYARPTELVDVRTGFRDGRAATGLASYAELAAFRSLQPLVARAGAFGATMDAALIRPDGTPVSVVAAGVTDGFFETLEMPMRLGRAFLPEEHQPGRDRTLHVVLSSRAWVTYFGADPGIIGTTIRIAELRPGITVVGVAAPELDLPHGADVWFNLGLAPLDETHFLNVVARLGHQATVEQLRAAAPQAMARAARVSPTAIGREFTVRSLVAALVGDLRPVLLFTLSATLLLLLLACVNVANLFLSRGVVRGREFALRTAIGASRARVIRQLLIESMILATAGAVAGLALAWGMVRLMSIRGASKLPRLDTVPVDGTVLAFALATVLFTGIAVGVAPAWQLWRTDARNLLNAGGRTMTSTVATSRLMSALIVVEIVLAISVVCGAGWLTQSYARLRATDLGFVTTSRLIVDARPARTFARGDEAHAWWDEALVRVRDAVGGAPVGLTTSYPLRAVTISTANVEMASQAPDPARGQTSHFESVSPDYFHAMGIRMAAGRPFTIDDRSNTEPVAIVNRAFVTRFLGDVEAVGQAFAYGFPVIDRQRMVRIVGVVEDVRAKSLIEAPEAAMYVPRAQWRIDYTRAPIIINAAGRSLEELKETARAALVRFEPQVLIRFTTAEDVLNDATSRQELGMSLMTMFGLTALMLAAVGIYGVVAYTVSQRDSEIATRVVFGATRVHVFWLLMRAGLRLAAVGTVFGLGTAYAGGRIVESRVFGMHASDPAVLAGSGFIVIAVTAMAIVIPSIRASQLNPVRILRAE